MQEHAAESLLNDSAAFRAERYGRLISRPFFLEEIPLPSAFGYRPALTDNPLLTVEDFQHSRDHATIRNIAQWSAKAAAAFHLKPLPQHVVNERLLKLLGAMAKDIGLADDLRIDDLGRVYFPVVQEQEQIIKNIQRQQTLARLLGENAAGASEASSPNTLWPPKPE